MAGSVNQNIGGINDKILNAIQLHNPYLISRSKIIRDLESKRCKAKIFGIFSEYLDKTKFFEDFMAANIKDVKRKKSGEVWSELLEKINANNIASYFPPKTLDEIAVMVAHWYLAENYIESDKLKDSPRIEYEKVRDSFNSCKNEEDFARMKVLVVEALLEKFSYTNESIEKYHIEEMEKLGRKAQLIEKKIQIYEELMIKCKDEIKHCSGFEEHGVLPKAIRKTLDKCLVKAKIVEQDHIALNKAKAKVKEEMVEREEKFKKFMKVGVTERTSHAQGMTQEQLKIELVNLVNLEVLKIQAKKAKKRDWFLECFEMSL